MILRSVYMSHTLNMLICCEAIISMSIMKKNQQLKLLDYIDNGRIYYMNKIMQDDLRFKIDNCL